VAKLTVYVRKGVAIDKMAKMTSWMEQGPCWGSGQDNQLDGIGSLWKSWPR